MSVEVLVPPLGQTVDTLTLVNWYKNEGDTVRQGEPLFAVETDKATLDVEAPATGILRHITARPGDQVKALNAIAVIVAPDESADELRSRGAEALLVPAVSAAESAVAARRQKVFISPRARRLAEQEKVPLTELKATGPEGAIIERDVRAYLAQREEARKVPFVPPVAPELLEIIPLSGVRTTIAERMSRSHAEAASVTLTAEADATALVGLRQQLAASEIEVSYNDLFLYVLAKVLREHPRLNASLDGDSIKVWRRIDIGLAVDTDRGLLMPVIRDVDHKGLAQLAKESNMLAERARAGQCTPDELHGSTFTLINLGTFGIDAFTPIINLAETAILGVGRIQTQPTWVGRTEPWQKVWLSLTFDHRLVDSGLAARFLQRVVELVEKPYLLLL